MENVRRWKSSRTHKENKKPTKKDDRKSLLFDFQGLLSPMKNGGVAQLGEHLPCKQGVKGSIPFISTSRSKDRENSGKSGKEAKTQEIK